MGVSSMKKLWAPWRMTYISALEKPGKGCVFCTKPKRSDDRRNLILWRGKKCFVVMNLYPYNNGHLMVVPYRHTSDIAGLDPKTITEMWGAVARSTAILKKAFKAEGFNVGLNLGRVAGAGIDQHVHLHIVPRWNGDTNFMAILGNTKVISQGMIEAYDELLPHFKKL
jgi:ATP adenylyltransferase